MADNIKSETLKGVKWSMVNSVGGKAIGFLLGVILARLLSPTDFGIVGMATIFFTLANILIDSGFASALIRKQNMTEEDTSTVFYFNLVVSSLMCVVLCCFSPNIAGFLNAPVLTDIVKVSAFTMLVGALGSVQFALFTKQINFKIPALITLISQVLSGVIGIYLAYTGHGPWALVWQSFSAAVFRTIIVWIWSNWRPKLVFSIGSFKELFGFGGNLALNSLFDAFFRDGIGMIIGKFYTPAQLGFYSRGQHTAQLPSTFLYGIVGQVTYPVLSKIQNDDERLLNAFRKFIKMFSLLIFFCMTLLIAIAKPLTIVLFSERWLDSVIYLQIFCFIYMFYHIHALNGNYLLVKGRSDWVLKKEIINKTFKIVLLVLMIPHGVLYICITFCFSTVFDLFVNTYVTGKLFGYGIKNQFADFTPYILVSIICCLPAFGLSYCIENSYISLFLGSLSSVALYIGFAVITKNTVFNELISLTPLKKYLKR